MRQAHGPLELPSCDSSMPTSGSVRSRSCIGSLLLSLLWNAIEVGGPMGGVVEAYWNAVPLATRMMISSCTMPCV